MKNREKKGILLVPPGGTKIRTIGVPRILIVAVCVLLCAGFAGYLIPFNSFTLDVVKQNQVRNLEDQNKRLRGIIRPLYRLHVTLSSELERLERKRESIVRRFGKKETSKRAPRQRSRFGGPSPDVLVLRVHKVEEMFGAVTSTLARNPAFFDSIPLVKPLDDKSSLGARFGMETDPFTGVPKQHNGIDFIGIRGAPVVATASGTVARVEDGKLWGKRVFISHGYGFTTVYAHLGTVDAFTGKKVSKGAGIGTMGISGVTSGPHLHYEVLTSGAPVNPEEMFFPDTSGILSPALQQPDNSGNHKEQ